jgi:HlyD family secretion protein
VSENLAEARRLIRFGLLVLLLGVLPVLAWLGLAPLAAAVVAPGVVKVDLNRRPVQHAEGGIVREVRVRDGQRVTAGETLVVLGDVGVDADMQRLDSRVRSERASIARLEAEQAQQPMLAFPDDITAAAKTDPGLADLLAKEGSLFEARRRTMTSQVALLIDQRRKAEEETAAWRRQIVQATQALKLQQDELASNRNLQRDGFVSATRVTQLEAQVADYGVKLEERKSELARAEQKLLDIDLKIKGIESEYRQQASDQLKATSARLSEIQQEQRKTGDAARRQVITAPATGDVMGLKVTSPGAVIGARETIAEVVPSNTRLLIEATIRPEDVSNVRLGQLARIRFTSFNSRTTRLVDGKVGYVSADRHVNPQTNAAYYAVHVEVDRASMTDAGDLQLQAGMPAEIYIEGDSRSALRYLVEPIQQATLRAGRER